MSVPMRTDGLRLDQAPPLAVPMVFFASAPIAVFAAGALLLFEGKLALASNWLAQTLALTHLGTLGFLVMVMMGALYQLTPVVAGSRVRGVRAAHAVHALFFLGVAGLVLGLITYSTRVIFVSIAALFFALLLFVLPVGLALRRAPARNETVTGMRVALASLFTVAFLGLWMAHGHSGMRFPGPRHLWIQVHLTVGFLGWIGCLISAVSWQVLPMFYLAPSQGPWSKRATLALVVVGMVLPVAVLFLDWAGLIPEGSPTPVRLAAVGALPAALGVWGIQPVLSLRGLAQRRRRRVDGSVRFWQAGLCAACLTAAVAVAAHHLSHPRWVLLLGWMAIWCWAGMIVHGMLTRIVPFLVWFHRFSPLVGRAPVPSMRGLLPDRWTLQGFALHVASAVAGIAAIGSGLDGLARLTGLLLMATAARLGHSILHVLSRRAVEPPPEPEAPPA